MCTRCIKCKETWIKLYSCLNDPAGFLPEDDWPRNGSVRFHNVHVRYASHLDAVLTNINIDISGGQKVL